MSVQELRDAMAGPKGSMDAYLEVRNDAEIKADILSISCCGLTKREQFAAMAMQGLMAATGNTMWSCESTAQCSVGMADALISELAKP